MPPPPPAPSLSPGPDPADRKKPADKPAWYGAGLSFTCTQCGNCCTGEPGFVWFSADEGRALAAAMGVDEPDFYRQYASKKMGRWTLNEVRQPDGRYDCVFLERDATGKGRCGVYQDRPTQCRTWPFWASNLKSREAWDAAAIDCPGMAAGGSSGESSGESSGGGGVHTLGRSGETSRVVRTNFVPAEEVRIIAASNPRGL